MVLVFTVTSRATLYVNVLVLKLLTEYVPTLFLVDESKMLK